MTEKEALFARNKWTFLFSIIFMFSNIFSEIFGFFLSISSYKSIPKGLGCYISLARKTYKSMKPKPVVYCLTNFYTSVVSGVYIVIVFLVIPFVAKFCEYFTNCSNDFNNFFNAAFF